MSGQILLRPIVVVAGMLAVTWSLINLPVFWRAHPIEEVANYVLGGTPYKPEALTELRPAIDNIEASSECEPRPLRGAAIVLLRTMEGGFVPDQMANLDQRIDAVQGAIRRSLACAPADPFLWLVLYSVESAKNGLRLAYLDYIRQSYRLGPREGWIAVKRVRPVFAIFPILPPDIADMAIDDFVMLVQNRLYDEPLAVLLGPGWNIRERLIAALSKVDERERRDFAARLYERGVNIAIPGVDAPGQRPWR